MAGRGRSVKGYYAKRIAANRAVWLWSAVFALLCTLISYPGIWYSDSYVRVTTGSAVLGAAVRTLTGHRAPLFTGNALTVTPSFFMALSQGLTGHVALYTFAQAFGFYAAMFLLIREMNPRGGRIQPALFAVCPLVYGMSVYYEAGIGCVTGIAGLILLFGRIGDEKGRWDRALEFLLIMFFSYVTFGYRTNALTIVPVLLYFLLRLKAAKKVKGLAALALALGLFWTKGLPWIFDIHSMTTASTGIVWEMLTAIQRMPAEERAEYEDYLDGIGGEGATRGALATSTEDTAGNFMWGDSLGIDSTSRPGSTAEALRRYARLMIEKPGVWWGVKRDVVLRSLGVTQPLDYSEYDYNRWDSMAEYGFNDSSQRRAFHRSFVTVCGALGFLTLRPWIPFLASLVLIAAEYIRRGALRRKRLFVLLLAAFYYLAYLLDTPAYDFRYFYPSLFLMLITDAAILRDLAGGLVRRIRGKEAAA